MFPHVFEYRSLVTYKKDLLKRKIDRTGTDRELLSPFLSPIYSLFLQEGETPLV